MAKPAVEELLRTVRWSAAGSRLGWPALESAVGTRFPTEFRELVESLPPGQFQVPLSILHPGAYESPQAYAEEVGGYARLLRDDADLTGFPYPIYPDPGGVVPWGVVGFDHTLCWLRDGDDPDRWPVVVCDRHLSSWDVYRLGTAEFLTAVLTLPSPIEPLAYIAEANQPPRFVSRSGETVPASREPDPAYWSNEEAMRPLTEPVDAVAALGAHVEPVPIARVDWGAVQGRLGLQLAGDYRRVVDELGPITVGPAKVSAPDGSADDFLEQYDKLRRRIVKERAAGGGPLGTVWPEQPDGLLRWGSLAGGGLLCWIPTTLDPGGWPVMALDASLAFSATYTMSASRFLLELATHPGRVLLPPVV